MEQEGDQREDMLSVIRALVGTLWSPSIPTRSRFHQHQRSVSLPFLLFVFPLFSHDLLLFFSLLAFLCSSYGLGTPDASLCVLFILSTEMIRSECLVVANEVLWQGKLLQTNCCFRISLGILTLIADLIFYFFFPKDYLELENQLVLK